MELPSSNNGKSFLSLYSFDNHSNPPVCRAWQNSTRSRACSAKFPLNFRIFPRAVRKIFIPRAVLRDSFFETRELCRFETSAMECWVFHFQRRHKLGSNCQIVKVFSLTSVTLKFIINHPFATHLPCF